MKNKYRKLAVIMLTAVCFAGCQQEDIVYPEPDAKVAETYLTLNELTQSPLQVPTSNWKTYVKAPLPLPISSMASR